MDQSGSLQCGRWTDGLAACAGNGSDGAPVQTPGTPARSFNGSETLGAGLANLRAASQRSAFTSPEDPEVRMRTAWLAAPSGVPLSSRPTTCSDV